MPYRDYTDFTEVGNIEDGGEIAANHADIDISMNEESYLYEDKGGATISGDFTHYHDVQILSTSDDWGTFAFWVVSNVVDDFKALRDGNEEAIESHIQTDDSNNAYIRLVDCKSGDADDSTNLNPDQRYYVKFERSGTTVTAKIYSDSSHTTLVDTLTVTQGTATAYRYVFAASAWNSGNAIDCYGDIWNLDLQEVVVVSQAWDSGYETRLEIDDQKTSGYPSWLATAEAQDSGYEVRLTTSKQQDSAYEARQSVVAQQDSAYDALRAAGLSHSTAYTVWRKLTDAQNSGYETRLALSAQSESAYAVLRAVGLSHEAAYTVWRELTAAQDSAYGVRISLAQQFASAYSALRAVGLSHETAYGIGVDLITGSLPTILKMSRSRIMTGRTKG